MSKDWLKSRKTVKTPITIVNQEKTKKKPVLDDNVSASSEETDKGTNKNGFRSNELSYRSHGHDISNKKSHKSKKKKSKHKTTKFSDISNKPSSNFRRNLLFCDDSDVVDESKPTEGDITQAMINGWLKSQNTVKVDVNQEMPEKVTTLNDSVSESSPKPKAEKPERELVALATKIAEKVKIISHNNGVYYYDGKTYRLIADENSLLRLVLKKVDASAFRAHATKMFKDIYAIIKADERFEPENYRRKLRESKHLIAFNNCLFNVKTGEKLVFSEEYLTFGAYDALYRDNPYPKQFLDCIEDWSGNNPEIKQRML